MGLAPFVKTLLTGGRVGSEVTILGNNPGRYHPRYVQRQARGAFTVNKTGSAITAKVPRGATTGTIQVTTPSGTLNSNVPFRVR